MHILHHIWIGFASSAAARRRGIHKTSHTSHTHFVGLLYSIWAYDVIYECISVDIHCGALTKIYWPRVVVCARGELGGRLHYTAGVIHLQQALKKKLYTYMLYTYIHINKIVHVHYFVYITQLARGSQQKSSHTYVYGDGVIIHLFHQTILYTLASCTYV